MRYTAFQYSLLQLILYLGILLVFKFLDRSIFVHFLHSLGYKGLFHGKKFIPTYLFGFLLFYKLLREFADIQLDLALMEFELFAQ